MTAHDAKLLTLKISAKAVHAWKLYRCLNSLGQIEVVCSNGYIATLVSNACDQHVGIELKSGEIYWFPNVTVQGSIGLVRELMGL